MVSDAEDAYGHELWDYYRFGTGGEVIERDDGFIDPSEVAPALYFAPFKEWPGAERRAISAAKGRVLDVGCGAGRASIYLQDQKGMDVLGIDISPLAVKVSKLRGLRKARILDFARINFPPDSFDTVVMFGNNFGLFGSREQAGRLLKRLHRMASADAVLICESADVYATTKPEHLRYHERNRARGRMAGQIRLRARYRSHVGRWFDYLLVSPDEMRELAKLGGWKVSRIIRSRRGPLYVGILTKQTRK